MGECPWQESGKLLTWEDRICGAVPGGNQSSCQGDSGGPLAWLDKSTSEVKIMGVTSYGPVPCGLAGIYAAVPHIVDWINEMTGSCNREICSTQKQCMTKKRLNKQTLETLGGGTSKKQQGSASKTSVESSPTDSTASRNKEP